MSVLVGVLVALVDGFSIQLAPYSGGRALLHMFAFTSTLLAALVFGFEYLGWTRLAILLPRSLRRTKIFWILAGVPFALFFWWVPSSWILEQRNSFSPIAWAALGAYLVFAWICAAFLVWGASRLLTLEVKCPGRTRLIGLSLLFLAGGFYAADAAVLVDLYEDFHVGLAGLFLFAATLGVRLVLGTKTPEIALRKVFVIAALAFTSLLTLSLVRPWHFTSSGALIFPKLVRLVAPLRASNVDAPETQGRSAIGEASFPIPICETCKLGYNVLLITVDALRPDHVGTYGYERKTTPHLDELAKKSLVFEQAFSQATKTFDSLPSLYSGRYPSRLTRDYKHPRLKKQPSFVFYTTKKTPLVSEGFRRRGYETAGYFRFPLQLWGLGRGLDHVHISRNRITRDAIKFIRKSKTNFYVALHYGFPHHPYVTHKGFDFGPHPIDRYDSEIAYADAQIGRLIRLLTDEKIAEETIVIISSDHGEEFGEHGGKFHARKLYTELLHVPLIVHIPGQASARLSEHVELVDVAPFLNDVAELGFERSSFDGQSLLATASGKRADDQKGAYAEDYRKTGLHSASIETADWRGILHVTDDRFELYDKHADRMEQNDVALEKGDVVKHLKGAIQKRKSQRRSSVQ